MRSSLLLWAAVFAAAPVGAAGEPPVASCCRPVATHGAIVWAGAEPVLTLERLAAYAAPVLWFSPDEPLLQLGQEAGRRARGREIAIPEPFPFEERSPGPVVYYRVRRVLKRPGDTEGAVYLSDPDDRGRSRVDLRKVEGIDLDFFFYYSTDVGGGAHPHDVELVETRLRVGRDPACAECPFFLVLMRTNGKAHGIQWYDNTLDVDSTTQLPVHVLVEEGKHASCPDRNADGQYTPGYDVTERVNDAWGVRDTLGTGTFFTGDYQSWMAKTRSPDTRVFPPLPSDSPLRERHTRDGAYAPDGAVYALRPYPRPDGAAPDLRPYIADKGDPGWPEIAADSSLERLDAWLRDESWARSWAVAFRADGDLGVSVAFPFLVVKNVQDPLAGGWFVNRVYMKDKDLRDFGWLLHYTQSASRWVDGYVSAGWERDVMDVAGGGTRHRNLFVSELGIKLRVNIHHTPAKFLARLGTDFWGLRIGLRAADIWDLDRIGYVVEFGAGSW